MSNNKLAIGHLRTFSLTTIAENKNINNDDVFEDSDNMKKSKKSLSEEVIEGEDTGRENLGFEEISDISSEDEHICNEGDDAEGLKGTPHRHMHKYHTRGIPRKILKKDLANGERRQHRRIARYYDNRKNGRINTHCYDEELKDESVEKMAEVHVDDEAQAEVIEINDISSNSYLTHIFPSEHTDVVFDERIDPHDTDVVFDEKNNGKGRYLNQTMKSRRANMELSENTAKSKTLCFLLKMHLQFCSLGMIAHGLAGGLALTQCIFVFSFFNQNDSILTENYSELAILFQSLYYFLLAISTVSIFDRYLNLTTDLSESLKHVINKPIRAITLVSYTLGLIFSVSLARLDEKISMYKSLSVTHDELTTWEILNFLRVLTTIAGWITIALAPTDDISAITVKNMMTMQQEIEMCHIRDGDDINTNILESGN